jgi:hypothetical protein
MGLTGVLVVTIVMGIPAICLIYAWRVRCQAATVSQGNWRLKLTTPGLWFATLSQLLACGFLIQGFRSDSQSFAEPAPLHWAVLNWVSVLGWGVALSTTAVGRGRARLSLFFWVLSRPLAAWVVIMLGYDY